MLGAGPNIGPGDKIRLVAHGVIAKFRPKEPPETIGEWFVGADKPFNVSPGRPGILETACIGQTPKGEIKKLILGKTAVYHVDCIPLCDLDPCVGDPCVGDPCVGDPCVT
jgi:hypothetical protein